MHVSDIQTAVVGNQRSDLRAAFRALVGWPGEAKIAGSTPAGRKRLLKAVCEALADDNGILPRGIADLIADECEDLDERTYASGAEAVLASWLRFAPILDRDAAHG